MDPLDASEAFRQALSAPRPERPFDSWERDVGRGWRLLIRGVHANLSDLDPEYRIGQIKEKFGGLRYYVDAFTGDTDEADRIVRAAEELSFKICEECGGPGETKAVNGFWLRTLCPLCRREDEDEREFKRR
jgi:hypothetical protein